MVTNLETRQNDVIDASNNGWPGDLFRKLWQEIRRGVKVVTWEQRRENERREQAQKEKQDLKNQRESTEETFNNREEIGRARHTMQNKIEALSRLEWQDRSYTFSDLLGPNKEYPDYNKGKKLWLTDRTIEEKWDKAYFIKWPSIELEIFENYLEDQKDRRDKKYYVKCACVIKNPDGDIVLDNMTMWDFRRVVDAINIDLDNRIKERQDAHKKALERIAWKKLAQNNEEYHQQEEQQADADLETQLWSLA